tara:strand:+ start:156 stop:761 length:606 start_codon:yes stop_codon:yes gene_type:complete
MVTLVAIIASFCRVLNTVATFLAQAVCGTTIGWIRIAIVTLLVPLGSPLDTSTQMPISTPGQSTDRGALVIVVGVAVIAGLEALFPLKEVGTNKTIATKGGDAVPEAIIGVIIVAVVAGFNTLLDDPITATRRPTLDTIIVRLFIAIVTGFTRTENAITTTGQTAIAQASILVDLIAIIAGFKTCLSLTQIKALNPITAGR